MKEIKRKRFQVRACLWALLVLTLSAPWLGILTNDFRIQREAKAWISGIHLHSYWFVLSLLSFLFFFQEDGISRGLKETEQESFKQKKTQAWSSHRDPYGCRAVVMSLSAHLLWLPSSLWRYPWGQNSCAFMCVWKDEFERVSKKCLEDNPAAVSICQDSGYILQIQYELKKLPVKYKVLNDDQKRLI